MSVLCEWDYVCDIVDDFVSDDKASVPSQFWRQIYNHPEAQQIYIQCLVFKYISFSLGFGHKPLREAIRVIKNFTGQNKTLQSVDIFGQNSTGNKGANPRQNPPILGMSPPKRVRANTGPNRRPSIEPKTSPRPSLDNSHSYHDKSKRKPSEGYVDSLNANFINSMEDRRMMKKLRDVMYTVSFLLNTCDTRRWDFSILRDIFLIWNKTRGWDQDPKNFEAVVMKFLSRPPEDLKAEQEWRKWFGDIFNGYLETCQEEKSKTLSDRKAGESTKFWVLRVRLSRNIRHIRLVLDALCENIEKVHEFDEEEKILPMLHIVCDIIITTPFIPLESLEKLYACLQIFYLWAKPISTAVKEVLDLLQTEMKSPGYFGRMIYCQEQELYDLTRATEVATSLNPVNVMVDCELNGFERLVGIFDSMAQKYEKVTRKRASKYHRVLIEHIYQSVFGPEGCDLKALGSTLKTCPVGSVSAVCQEALSVMEQSIAMETHAGAQEYIRQQLESLSSQLVDETADAKSTEEGLNDEEDNSSSSLILDSKQPPLLRPSSSTGSLSNVGGGGGVVLPPRNHSYLSRTTSSASLKSTTSAKSIPSSSSVEDPPSFASEAMGDAPVTVKPYEKENLAENLYQIVRATAKDYFIEKRRSGSFTSARKEYIKSHKLRMSEPRDSGVDFSEPPEAQASERKRKSQSNSTQSDQDSSEKASSAESEKLWNEFLKRGFDESGESDFESMLHDLTLETPKKEIEVLEFKPSPDHLPVPEMTSPPLSVDVAETMESFDASFSGLSVQEEPEEEEEDSSPADPKSRRKEKKKQTTKNRFKTFGRKGRKLVRGAVKRTTSMRSLGPDKDEEDQEQSPYPSNEGSASPRPDDDVKSILSTSSSSSSTPPSAAMAFFDAMNIPRWRTVSDPLRTKKSRSRGSKYIHLSNIFHSTDEVNQGRVSQSFLYPAAHSSGEFDTPAATQANGGNLSIAVPRKHAHTLSAVQSETLPETPKRKGTTRRLYSEGAKLSPAGEDEARNRMDSGVVVEKLNERPRYRRGPSLCHGSDYWDETGVAGVKISRKLAVRKNRKSRSSMSRITERSARKKILKLAFVGNDRTIGNLARAYYDVRKRQLTRAPLLNHVDLRIYYIPVGENSYEDERIEFPGEPSTFDLKVGEMIGRADPWYQSTVLMTFNKMLRICPKNSEENEEASEVASERSNSHLIPENILASSLSKFSRFAVTTYNVPLFKATMRSSTDENISVVFCCGIEIGSIAHRQAVMQGRFGKLADINSEPPETFSSFEFAKFGINAAFKSSTKLEARCYRSVSVTPIAFSDTKMKNQSLYSGADSLQVTMVDNEKYAKYFKKLRRGQSEDELLSNLGNKLFVSAAKMEVERPQQGTFAVWIDQTLIYTNIKSIEIGRCPAPEFERGNAPRRKCHSRHPHFVSLPLKTFWPASNPSC